ncbi:site-specific recombinase XerD [Nonomuraea thailandensis]|uniref:Site-specific recombinase XerD n=1 Tax=Nonomuraea thailandensis TaxID=1188745 RepID=A0A9X2G967_9ACTN|nr:tyrosine-type recombinase/integrase [Nonomuraea thailandensis]MCP2353367.1 site-specific recombinase XerD [Nonomuraea thailandensis]
MVYDPAMLHMATRGRRPRLNTAALAAASTAAQRYELISTAVAALHLPGLTGVTDRHGVVRLTAGWLDSHASPATIAAYYADLQHYLHWCPRHCDPLYAYRAEVEPYVTELEKRYAPSTMARKLSAISSWYRYLLKHDVGARNPFTGVERPATGHHTTAIALSRDEAAAFLKAAAADPRPIRLRTVALLILLLTEGLRVAEVCAADVTNLGHRRGYRTLNVIGKDGRQRSYPLARPIATAVEDYLLDRAERAGVAREQLTGPLFVTEPSGPHPGGKRMDRWAVNKLIRRIARDAHLPAASKLTPTSLRHTFARLALTAGAALRDVQDAMGNASSPIPPGYHDRHNLDRHPAPRILDYLSSPAPPRRNKARPAKPKPRHGAN